VNEYQFESLTRHIAMSIADSELLPLNYIDYANSISSYIDTTKNLAKSYGLDEHIDFSSLEVRVLSFLPLSSFFLKLALM